MEQLERFETGVRLSVVVEIEQSNANTTLSGDDLLCDDSPHKIEIGMDGVEAVRANAASADQTGAWAIIVHGSINE